MLKASLDNYQWLVFMLMSCLCQMCFAETNHALQAIQSDGMNLTILEQSSSERAIITQTAPVHNWFFGEFNNLPIERVFSLGLQLESNNERKNAMSIAKWEGLMPVMTYADPTQYASYECFVRNPEGEWHSTDIFKDVKERYAGNGRVPIQHCIPEMIAYKFLTPEGNVWIPWCNVASAQAVPALNIFRIQQQFDIPTASIAMRIPFTYTHLQEVITRIGRARLPGVSILDVGVTPEKRKLQLICVTDNPSDVDRDDERKTVLVIAREHATEHATSWVIMGMLSRLLAETSENDALRHNITWLLLPIEDPDGSASAHFDRLTDAFRSTTMVSDLSPEVISYLQYFAGYYNSGKTIDVVVSLHNVEANEGVNVFCPIIDSRHPSAVTNFNETFYTVLKQQRYITSESNTETNYGFPTFRLYGWCADHFNAFNLAYEINDRYPQHQLNLLELQHIGSLLTESLAEWAHSDTGDAWHKRVKALLQLHLSERQQYLRNSPDSSRNMQYDLFNMAY